MTRRRVVMRVKTTTGIQTQKGSRSTLAPKATFLSHGAVPRDFHLASFLCAEDRDDRTESQEKINVTYW